MCITICLMKYFNNNRRLSVIKYRGSFGWCFHKISFNFLHMNWVLIVKLDFYYKYYMLPYYEVQDIKLFISCMFGCIGSYNIFVYYHDVLTILLRVQRLLHCSLEGDRPVYCPVFDRGSLLLGRAHRSLQIFFPGINERDRKSVV